MKKYLLLVGLLIFALIFWSLIRSYKDNVIPFLRYKPAVDSLYAMNGSTFYYFAKLDTMEIRDTIVIAVYGRLPILVWYNTFEKRHEKKIKLPKHF